MNSLEVMNFAVHNVSELPTAVNGRLVYHDGVLKFGYTANSTTQWTTLLDSARFSTSDYKTWSYISSHLNTNFYTKTEVDTKVGERLLTSTFNSYKSSTDSSISTLNSWKSTASNQISALETWKTSASATLEILTGSSDSNGTINKWKELEAFLAGFSDSESEALKTQLDAKVAKGPNSGTSGIASATTYTPTLGTMKLSSRSAKAYRRITVDANGDLTSEMYKFVIDFTVDSTNTATYVQMQAATFLNAFSTTAGMNGFQELTVQTYKNNSDGSFSECLVDVRQDNAGVVLLFGTAPTSGTYRVIVMR